MDRTSENPPNRGYELAKRLFDLVASSAGLVVLSPLLIGIAVIVRSTSPGPVFYRGVRVGYRGEKFRIFKFRTMRADAEPGSVTTALNDPRVTRVGGVLRRYKLDELPQLLNVLGGTMSIVGPRPEVEENTSAYSAEEQAILDVKPGITDYASIELVNLDELVGSENAHEVFVTRVRDRKNALRLRYVRQRSFSEDMRIIVRTFAAIAGKARGAHPS